MPYALSEVIFAIDLPMPDGRFGRKIVADSRTKLTRDGDTIVVEANLPTRDFGKIETVVLDYNWGQVALSKRAPVEKAPAPAKK